MKKSIKIATLVFLFMTTCCGTAFAYMGPGAGLTALGSLFALIGIILLAIMGFLWYPVKRLFSKKKGEPAVPGAEKRSDE